MPHMSPLTWITLYTTMLMILWVVLIKGMFTSIHF